MGSHPAGTGTQALHLISVVARLAPQAPGVLSWIAQLYLALAVAGLILSWFAHL